jgi:hypothetical protein
MSNLPNLPEIPDYRDEFHASPEEPLLPPKSCACCPPAKTKWEIGENLAFVLFVTVVMLGMVLLAFSGKLPH